LSDIYACCYHAAVAIDIFFDIRYFMSPLFALSAMPFIIYASPLMPADTALLRHDFCCLMPLLIPATMPAILFFAAAVSRHMLAC